MSVALLSAVLGSPSQADALDLTSTDTYANTLNVGVSYPGYRNTNGRTTVDKALVSGQRTVTIIVAGQSNACSVSLTPYTPSSSLVHNLNIYDGGMYRAKDPMLGCSHTPADSSFLAGSWLGRFGDALITAGAIDRVILVPCAMAGSYAIQWNPDGPYYPRLRIAIQRCQAAGLTPDAAIWSQGEGDCVIGTSQANYQTYIGNMIAQSRTDGFSGPWFINKQSWTGGSPNAPSSYVSSAVQAAQTALVNHGSGIWAGADFDSLNNTNRNDLTHFNDTGMAAAASLMASAVALYGAPFA